MRTKKRTLEDADKEVAEIEMKYLRLMTWLKENHKNVLDEWITNNLMDIIGFLNKK